MSQGRGLKHEGRVDEMKIEWGVIAGLAAAALLVAAVPTQADEKAQAGQPGQKPEQATSGQAAGKGELTGKVQKVDHEKKTLTLGGKELKLTDTTTVTKAGQPSSHADIKEGDEVRASFSPDTLQVSSIEVKAAGAAEPAAPGEKPAETPPKKP
jgi:Cu/Ag efflux protein CusF